MFFGARCERPTLCEPLSFIISPACFAWTISHYLRCFHMRVTCHELTDLVY